MLPATLSIADIDRGNDGEPRICDLRLAEALGFSTPLSIRKLIERHRQALARFGEVFSTVEKTSPRGGRPGKAFWLSKRQALYICTKSETGRATDITIQIVEVFDAAISRPPALHANPDLTDPFVLQQILLEQIAKRIEAERQAGALERSQRTNSEVHQPALPPPISSRDRALAPSPSSAVHLLRFEEVRERVGYTRSYLLRLEKWGRFPRRVRLGDRSVAWIESEIDEWIAARIAQRGS